MCNPKAVNPLRIAKREPELPLNWKVRLPDSTIRGPFHESHIRDLLSYNSLPENIEIAAVDSENWCPVDEHSQAELFRPQRKSIQLVASRANEAITSDSEPFEIEHILKHNLDHEEQVKLSKRTTSDKISSTSNLLMGHIMSIVLFLGIGLVAVWFLFEEPGLLHYLGGGALGAVAGWLYARNASGGLTNWSD